ncbi:MAG: hypothetical protein KF754_04190 [Planctomycetes bacterium]|nr:hypothetical protein [Planctomycetota bacterium]
MKTFAAAVVAGLLGAGAAVGAVAAGWVQAPTSEPAPRRASIVAESEPAGTPDHSAEINALRTQIKDLELALDKGRASDNSAEIAKLKAEIEGLKRQGVVAAKPAEPVTAPQTGPAPAEPDFEAAVRAVSAKMEAERVEQRRLDRQAARITQLEESKKRIAENTPKFVESQAQRLNLDASQVTAVSTALVAHLQARAELDSERQGMRIDDREVDQADFEAREKVLNDAALNALTATLPKETAEQLLRTANRMGGGAGAGRGPGGFQPGQGGQPGGGMQPGGRQRGNN